MTSDQIKELAVSSAAAAISNYEAARQSGLSADEATSVSLENIVRAFNKANIGEELP
jgi:hypothetical protein